MRSGFTTFELLTVVGVMSIAMAIAAPRFGPPRARGAVRAARMQVTSLLETARAAAVRRGQPASFHASATQIWVTAIENGSPVPLGPRASLGSQLNVSLNSSASAIAFGARGFVSNGVAPVTIVISREAESDTVCVTRGGAIIPHGCGL